jgi:hypothetical protein
MVKPGLRRRIKPSNTLFIIAAFLFSHSAESLLTLAPKLRQTYSHNVMNITLQADAQEQKDQDETSFSG